METASLELLKEKLGERIRALRDIKGLSLRKFALLAEIEHPQLINIEKGRVDLKLSTLNKIAKGFEINVAELFNF